MIVERLLNGCRTIVEGVLNDCCNDCYTILKRFL